MALLVLTIIETVSKKLARTHLKITEFTIK